MGDRNLEMAKKIAEGTVHLEIAKMIGQPIDENLPVPAPISAIADVFTAEPGEKVFTFSARDDDPDEVYDVDVNGAMTVVKRDPLGDAQLTFKGLSSKLEYVLVDTVLSSVDIDVLGRKKNKIVRGMDKLELRLVLKAIMDSSDVQSVTLGSTQDLYDVIQEAIHLVEDYGDNYVLLCGTTVKEKIDTYDKEKAGTHNYKVGLKEFLRESGVNVIKVFGKVKTTGDSVATRLMDADKFILIALDSTIAEGKPLAFVRRRISPDIARLMGANVETAERAIIANPTPVVVSGTNTLAYGVAGYESIIWAILNPKAVVKSGAVV